MLMKGLNNVLYSLVNLISSIKMFYHLSCRERNPTQVWLKILISVLTAGKQAALPYLRAGICSGNPFFTVSDRCWHKLPLDIFKNLFYLLGDLQMSFKTVVIKREYILHLTAMPWNPQKWLSGLLFISSGAFVKQWL